MSQRKTYRPADGSVEYLMNGLSIATIADGIVGPAEDELRKGISLPLVNIGLSQSRDLWRRELDDEDFARLEVFVRRELSKSSYAGNLVWK